MGRACAQHSRSARPRQATCTVAPPLDRSFLETTPTSTPAASTTGRPSMAGGPASVRCTSCRLASGRVRTRLVCGRGRREQMRNGRAGAACSGGSGAAWSQHQSSTPSACPPSCLHHVSQALLLGVMLVVVVEKHVVLRGWRACAVWWAALQRSRRRLRQEERRQPWSPTDLAGQRLHSRVLVRQVDFGALGGAQGRSRQARLPRLQHERKGGFTQGSEGLI